MKKPTLAAVAIACALMAACSPSPQAPNDLQFSVVTNPPQTASNQTVVDFESQPINGSSQCSEGDPNCTAIANPLVIDGATFTDQVVLGTGFCSSPTCEPDPDNPDQGNIGLFMNPGGTISFPSNTGNAQLTIEGIGNNPLEFEVSDFSGHSEVVESAGVEFDKVTLDLSSPHGISRIEVVSVGGTGGPLVLTEVSFGRSRRP
jgi:hypothetical protein